MPDLPERQALPIYAINLDRAKKRWSAMQKGLQEQGLVAKRLSAFDAQTSAHLPVSRYDEAGSRRYNGAPQIKSTMAGFASHYRAWQIIRDSGGSAVVMEDDLAFQDGFVQALDLAAAQIEERHYIRLFALNRKRRALLIETLAGGFKLVCLTYRPIGTQAYLLSAEGAERLIAHAERWFQPVDDYLDCFWVHGLPPFAIQPYRIEHADEGFSYLQSGREPYRRSLTEQLRFKLRRRTERLQARFWLLRHPPR